MVSDCWFMLSLSLCDRWGNSKSKFSTSGLLQINPKTGEIKTKAMLTGKGRADPYELVIRAQDSGGQLPKQSSLYNDVSFTLYIGDISANDGIPFFIAPQVGQTANVTEVFLMLNSFSNAQCSM